MGMQDFGNHGFKGCMTRYFTRFLRPVALLASVTCLLFQVSCAKADYGTDVSAPQQDPGVSGGGLAIGTLRSRDGVRFIQLDDRSAGYVTDPEMVREIPDGTRVFLEYRSSLSVFPDFCTESLEVLWATPIEVGSVSDEGSGYYDSSPGYGDPLDVLTDWMTSLEDGFLTVHYSIPASGKVQHSFTLARGVSPLDFFLLQDAHGDAGTSVTEGLVCFPVTDLLPDTEGETVTLSLYFTDTQHKLTSLTIDYRNPK